MTIRKRVASDLSELEALARRVHQLDGYPPYMPDDDFLNFVASDEALESWVAVAGEVIAGHIALHQGSSPEVIALATSSLGIQPSQCGVVARLLVAPEARRSGVGRQLLDHAETEARRRNLVPILDVVEHFDPAITLYERAGWTRLGTVVVNLPDGTTAHEHVYAAPAAS